MRAKILFLASVLLLLILASGCGAASFSRGNYLYQRGQYDEAVDVLEKAYKSNPNRVKTKTILVRAKLAASQKHLDNARMALGHQDLERALQEIQLAMTFDPSNQLAQDTFQKILAAVQEEEESARRSRLSLEAMKKEAQKDMGVPQLDPASNIPIVLKFTSTPLKTILDAVSKASGINFLYDDKAEASKAITVDFAKVDLAQVLGYLMMQTKHFYKVLDPHTLIIVPDNKQKRDEYQDQVIRTFYLSNADAKDVFQLVRSILQAKKMAMNQDLNSITIQDSPEVVAICQRIIGDNDKSKGEVVVDVELLEVNSDKTRQLGINLTARTFTIGPEQNVTKDSSGNATGIGTGPPVPLNEFGQTLAHNLWIFPVPNLVVKLLLDDTDSQILAKPQLRVMEGQKASVHIGDKIPIPTSNQYLSTQSTTQNYTPITSYTYQDVGVKIEIEPKVHHNREVTIKLKTEVSSVTGYVKGNAISPDQPIIGTREVTTVIRLEDGESSLLAGLIRKEDSKAISGLPGIAEVPVLRRLFSDTTDHTKKTDVVVLLTPHILRMPNIREEDVRPLWVGTADRPRLRDADGGFGAQTTPFAPSGGQPPAAKEEPKAKEKPEEKKEPPSKETADKEQPASPTETQPKETQPADASASSAGRLLVSPTNITVPQGTAATLNLVLIGAKNLKGAHLEMDYPNDVLQFQGMDEGTFFKLGGGATSFTARESRPGVVAVDINRTDGSGASGSGLVARVRFMGQKGGEGRANFGVAQATDVSGQTNPLPPTFAIISVVASPPPSTPAPGGGGG